MRNRVKFIATVLFLGAFGLAMPFLRYAVVPPGPVTYSSCAELRRVVEARGEYRVSALSKDEGGAVLISAGPAGEASMYRRVGDKFVSILSAPEYFDGLVYAVVIGDGVGGYAPVYSGKRSKVLGKVYLIGDPTIIAHIAKQE